MSDKQFKTLRKQLKNVVQDALPAVLTQELVLEIREELLKRVDTHFEKLSLTIKNTLDGVEKRSKETQNYILRNTTPQAPATTTDQT